MCGFSFKKYLAIRIFFIFKDLFMLDVFFWLPKNVYLIVYLIIYEIIIYIFLFHFIATLPLNPLPIEQDPKLLGMLKIISHVTPSVLTYDTLTKDNVTYVILTLKCCRTYT